jgi:hypothetical protein
LSPHAPWAALFSVIRLEAVPTSMVPTEAPVTCASAA